MKKILTLFIIINIYLKLPAQNVGIGNTNPQTALDVKGVIRSRPDTAIISLQDSLVEVSKTNYLRLISTGSGIPGQQYILNLTPGKDGQHLRLESIGGTRRLILIDKTYMSNGKIIVLSSQNLFLFDDRKGSYLDLFYSDAVGWTETARHYLPSYVLTDLHKQVFTSSGDFMVPYGIDSIAVAVWGAGGHTGGAGSSGSGTGGNGGFIAGKLKVVQGEILNITVASATYHPQSSKYSAIIRRISFFPDETKLLVLAAGGGNGSFYGGIGGNAGSVGQAGILNTEPGTLGAPGGGATVSAGGAGGLTGTGGGTNGTNGTSLTGGICTSQINSKEGCGGAGYFGGGGASSMYSSFFSITFASGGGGGASNYATDFTFTHNTHVGNISPSNPLYDNGGFGGIGPGSTNPASIGQAGKVVITW